MQITGRAELGKTGKQSRMRPDPQLPWPAAFTTQKALTASRCGDGSTFCSESVGDVLRGLGWGQTGSGDGVQAMHLHLGMARKLFLFLSR